VSIIELRGVSKSYSTAAGIKPVLRNASLTVEDGEFVSIVGAMGSGKTTLLSIAAGLLPADGGDVWAGGEPLREIRRDGAFVFQNYSLLPWFSALENVRLAVDAAFPTLSRDEQRRAAIEALERVGLGNAVQRRPSQLSGGMRQRVAIARALATRPRVLFLDEPFGALDALTRETLQQELAHLCSDGERTVTTLMITNSVEEAILLSDRIIPMLPGPPATLGAPIAVPLARPRTVADLAHQEEATRVRAHVVATLTAAMKDRAPAGSACRRTGEARDQSPAAITPPGLTRPGLPTTSLARAEES
jgi:nitrate/nitrite transport system ATP-binding protein